MKALTKTDYNFPGQQSVYHGKVRDVYNINGEKLVMVATDRISAFDVILPKGIPYKGQILNQIAAKFLDATTDICPNWKLATPDPMVTVGVFCEGFPLEMIVRGYLCGSAWRAYKSGVREICGVRLPRRARCRHLQGRNLGTRPLHARGIRRAGGLHPAPLRARNADSRRAGPHPGGHEVRVRQARGQDLPHGRDTYARLQPLLLQRRLRGAFRPGRAATPALEGVRARKARRDSRCPR